MPAELIEYVKQNVRGRYVMDIRVWRLDDKRYTLGLKYALVFIEKKTGKKVLMDNHHPKNPHIHLDDKESDYDFVDVKTLIADFRKFIFLHFGERV